VKKNFDNAKANIVLIFAIMSFLLIFCFLFYSGLFKEDDMKVNTNLEFSGGNDVISQKLQKIIPFSDLTDPNIKTAYQSGVVFVGDIDNNIFLLKALEKESESDIGSITKSLNKMYGDSLFLVHNDFNVNGKYNCLYNTIDQNYKCEDVSYNGKIYKAYRKIKNITISNNDYLLNENIVFYSEEKANDITYYEVYDDGTFTKKVSSFTTIDMTRENLKLEDFIDKYYNDKNVYRSKFTLENKNYIWNRTERLK